MDAPLVDLLLRQQHSRVAKCGKDNRWKHLSGKPPSKPGIPIRAVEDHHVDRLEVEAQQCVKRTSTNCSIGLIQQCSWAAIASPHEAHKSECLYNMHRSCRPGGYSEGSTPVPIPNTAVKTFCANGTMS